MEVVVSSELCAVDEDGEGVCKLMKIKKMCG